MQALSVRKYFVQQPGDVSDESESRQVALGGAVPEADDEEDELTIAALQYLNSVKQESARLPFAVVAEYSESDQVAHSSPTILASSSDTDLDRSVSEYFEALRVLLSKNGAVEKSSCEIAFDGGSAELQVACADQVSIEIALENLAMSSGSLPESIFTEYLWTLLVYLELPLLEETAANLQSLRRMCDSHSGSSRLWVCSLVISRFFHQR